MPKHKKLFFDLDGTFGPVNPFIDLKRIFSLPDAWLMSIDWITNYGIDCWSDPGGL